MNHPKLYLITKNTTSWCKVDIPAQFLLCGFSVVWLWPGWEDGGWRGAGGFWPQIKTQETQMELRLMGLR